VCPYPVIPGNRFSILLQPESDPIQPSPTQSNLVQPGPTGGPGLKRPFAWQPLTPKGIAAFAGSTVGRVLAVQFVFALLAASTVTWFVDRNWFPTITQAIKQLPTEGEIRSGRLTWNGDSPVPLAENRFLAVAVDLKHEGEARSPAHVAVELGERDFKIYSLLGYVEGVYSPRWRIGFNRTEATPWWGAWAPPILGIVALLVIISLLPCWTMLATLYAGPAWLVGFFANRDLNLAASWRISGAVLMPGCVLFSAAIVLYGLGFLDLIRLGVAVAAHLVVGWVYLWLTIRKLPLHPDAATAKPNPFIGPTSPASEKTKEQQ
jgi:hypothetical protein